jgi:hypothetical protein
MASGQDGTEVVASDTAAFGAAEAPAAVPLGRSSEQPSSWVPDARSTPARGVDELIDLEQEVEFFVLLGDEHAAIDLLEAHLGGNGGGSPLPYLHLLQMHRGQQDRAAYAQVAKRFGQRFGVEAPGWDADGQGRELHDCPVALTELQARWASPAQAVAWLEQQLFIGPGSEMPGLPAYRDLLTLYAIARELQGHAREADTEVDVLLPLDGSAAPRRSIFDTLDPAPKATVDLDLSEAGARPH